MGCKGGRASGDEVRGGVGVEWRRELLGFSRLL